MNSSKAGVNKIEPGNPVASGIQKKEQPKIDPKKSIGKH